MKDISEHFAYDLQQCMFASLLSAFVFSAVQYLFKGYSFSWEPISKHPSQLRRMHPTSA